MDWVRATTTENPARVKFTPTGASARNVRVTNPTPQTKGNPMLLVVAILLLLLFGGLGLASHVLWWGLILALIVGVAWALSGRRL